jgi:hypothetical protein
LTTNAVNAVTSQYRRDLAALRELVDTRLTAMDKANELLYSQLVLSMGNVPTETDDKINVLRTLLNVRIDNLGMLLDERYATQTKALDAAFVAAEKATATALASAEKAVGVAAASNEARFQGVNEFRKTLSDQAATFLPRLEYSTAHQALEDKLVLANDRLTALELRHTSRLDLGSGAAAGQMTQRSETRENLNTRLVTLGVVVSVVVILVNIVIAIIIHK